jgi:hypothetical protein
MRSLIGFVHPRDKGLGMSEQGPPTGAGDAEPLGHPRHAQRQDAAQVAAQLNAQVMALQQGR